MPVVIEENLYSPNKTKKHSKQIAVFWEKKLESYLFTNKPELG